MEYRELAEKSGIVHWRRVPALNTDERFIADMADMVVSQDNTAQCCVTHIMHIMCCHVFLPDIFHFSSLLYNVILIYIGFKNIVSMNDINQRYPLYRWRLWKLLHFPCPKPLPRTLSFSLKKLPLRVRLDSQCKVNRLLSMMCVTIAAWNFLQFSFRCPIADAANTDNTYVTTHQPRCLTAVWR